MNDHGAHLPDHPVFLKRREMLVCPTRAFFEFFLLCVGFCEFTGPSLQPVTPDRMKKEPDDRGDKEREERPVFGEEPPQGPVPQVLIRPDLKFLEEGVDRGEICRHPPVEVPGDRFHREEGGRGEPRDIRCRVRRNRHGPIRVKRRASNAAEVFRFRFRADDSEV